ncbi:hypothetical protein [Nubsella zeaxanthinifaciens]|uniref:hypothetical protein n=1 Tax=Nubsella zeaxanthinifaciens TaxID=392412 RepID=UPI000DE53532|nr:hypothetical protein [Nubsella zeaxanthinifaciens]
MNRRFLTAGLGLAALLIGGQTNAQAVQRINTANEVKATVATKRKSQEIAINAMGGLDFRSPMYYFTPKTNWVPKFGHPKRKTNKLRCKHNAKLKRRK